MKSEPLNRKDNIEDLLALSPMQEGIIYHYLKDKKTNQYIQQLCLNFSGNLQIDFFRKAWDFVVENNEILRTIYAWKGLRNPVQIVLKKNQISFTENDLSVIEDEVEKQNELSNIKKENLKNKYQLDVGPLFRVTVCKLTNESHEIIMNWHHILFDGWSTGVILKELFVTYSEIEKGKEPTKQGKNRFKNYLKWLQNQDQNAQHCYWGEYLRGFETKTLLPFERKKLQEISVVENYTYSLPDDLVKKLEKLALERKVTVGTIFYTSYGILLHKYNNAENVVFGTTVAGRSPEIPNVENMVGLFVNTLPLRVRVNYDQKVTDLIDCLHKEIQRRQAFECTPLVDIISYSETTHDNSLFDSIVVIENYPLDQGLANEKETLKVNSYQSYEMSNFDLTMIINAFSDIELNLLYNPELFSKETIQRFTEHFVNVLFVIAENPETKTSTLDILSQKEKERILTEFNQTKIEYPKDKTIHQFFEEQVQKTPENIALVYKEQVLTYRKLNEKANQLARRLREKGVGSDQIVGIMVDRSIEMLIGIFGILKAGGAYLPIDPDYPEDRIRYILDDSKTDLVLIQGYLMEKIHFEGDVIDLENGDLFKGNDENLEFSNPSTDLAYIIYTSGSTGKPKGVMVEHRNAVNILLYLHSSYPFTDRDAYLLKTTFTFDVSVTEIFGWFFGNGRLVVPEKGIEKDPRALIQAIDEHNITHINFVPSMLNMIIHTLKDEEIRIMNKLKYVFVAGEAISPVLVKEFFTKVPDVEFENHLWSNRSNHLRIKIFTYRFNRCDVFRCNECPNR